jgi:hypothetical protein
MTPYLPMLVLVKKWRLCKVMPKFLADDEIERLEKKISTEPHIKEKIFKQYEDYKFCVEMITPLIYELRKYCFEGEIPITFPNLRHNNWITNCKILYFYFLFCHKS